MPRRPVSSYARAMNTNPSRTKGVRRLLFGLCLMAVALQSETEAAEGPTWGKNDLLIEFGEHWGEDKRSFGCSLGLDGGLTTVTIPSAPNGKHDLWLRMFHQNRSGLDPQPRFLLDKEAFDFVPGLGTTGGYQWRRMKTVDIAGGRFTFTLEDRDEDGSFVITGVGKGDHVLRAKLATKSGRAIEGTTVVVYFSRS